MIKSLKKLNNTGDTIVEVLIVLAVLGLAMSISYATANRGLQKSRNAQEHSQALGIINSQIELLRSAFAKQVGGAIETQGGSGPFCLSTSGTNVTITPLANSGPNQFNENLANDRLDNTTTYPGPCIQNTLYDISIVGRGNGVYDFRVRWEGLGNLGRQQEELTYKIGNVIVTPTSGYTDPEVPPPPATPSLALSFTTSSTSVSGGDTFRLDWATTPSATGCTASGDWSGSKNASGTTNITVPVSAASSTLTYNLVCTLGAAPPASQTVTVNVAAYVPNLVTLYRKYNYTIYDHFYTTTFTEGSPGWTDQGNVGKVDTTQGPGEVPLYRLLSTAFADHYYTASAQNKQAALNLGYIDEGISGYIMPYTGACPAGTRPLYQLYSSYLGDHFYTTNFSEYNSGTDSYWTFLNGPGQFGGPFGTGHFFGPWYNYPEGITGCTFL
jgi:type II secretory pathway pseudopilin PulG